MAIILVAEDDKFLADAYKTKLTKLEHEVIIAKDGVEVLSILSKTIPDLIILDLMMPKKDGFQVLEELKAKPEWKNIPVIVASNLSEPEDIKLGQKLGAEDYIVKASMSIDELAEKIKSVLAGKD